MNSLFRLALTLVCGALALGGCRETRVGGEAEAPSAAVPAEAGLEALPIELYGIWIHSREEDRDGVAVYRRPDHDFPPTRGRDGLVFHEGGALELLGPGPGDAGESRPARWERRGPALLEVLSLDEEAPRELFRIELLAVTAERLEARILYRDER